MHEPPAFTHAVKLQGEMRGWWNPAVPAVLCVVVNSHSAKVDPMGVLLFLMLLESSAHCAGFSRV